MQTRRIVYKDHETILVDGTIIQNTPAERGHNKNFHLWCKNAHLGSYLRLIDTRQPSKTSHKKEREFAAKQVYRNMCSQFKLFLLFSLNNILTKMCSLFCILV